MNYATKFQRFFLTAKYLCCNFHSFLIQILQHFCAKKRILSIKIKSVSIKSKKIIPQNSANSFKRVPIQVLTFKNAMNFCSFATILFRKPNNCMTFFFEFLVYLFTNVNFFFHKSKKRSAKHPTSRSTTTQYIR